MHNLSSRFPRPTNAQAVAALDLMVDESAPAGLADNIARAYYPPDGILPRMRMLAWGWTKPGDKFKSPNDAAWWAATYQFPLWNPLTTLVQQLDIAGIAPAMALDEDLAKGDPAELSRSFPIVVAESGAVEADPSPKFLIPPGAGQLPIANPAAKGVLDPIDHAIRNPVKIAPDVAKRVVGIFGIANPLVIIFLAYVVYRVVKKGTR
jgi:hypothetical protein